MDRKKLRKLILAAFFAALIFLGIYIIKIPTLNGYVHFGDGLIYVAASLISLPYAIAAAAVGGALSDLLAGYAVYVPATAIIKGLMALAVGLIMKNNRFVNRLRGRSEGRGNAWTPVLAAVAGGAVNVFGYFVAECIMYGVAGAAAALGGNAIQSAAGVVIYMVLLPVAAKALQYFNVDN